MVCITMVHRMDRAAYRVNPFESPLWAHLEEIRQLRKARLTWTGIARHFAKTHQIRRTPVAIYRFYKRAASKPKPLGFDETEPLRSLPSTTQGPSGDHSSVVTQAQRIPPDLFEPLPVVERNPWLA